MNKKMNRLIFSLLGAVLVVMIISSFSNMGATSFSQQALVGGNFWGQFFNWNDTDDGTNDDTVKTVMTSPGKNCPGPTYVSGTSFPPTDVKPPLPPLSDKPYEGGDEPNNYDCDNFAQDFCKSLKGTNPTVWCYEAVFDRHSINLIIFSDKWGVGQVCFVEPQTNKYTCMKRSDWDKLDQEKWIQTVLCMQYYGYSEEDCNKPFMTVPFVGSCSDNIGKSCEFGSSAHCSDPNSPGNTRANRGFQHLACTCTTVSNCKWQIAPPLPEDTITVEPILTISQPSTPSL